MKIIFLNALNGDQTDEFKSFITAQAKDVDVFCFQEAYDKMQNIVRDILMDFKPYTRYQLAYREGDYIEDFALATYVRNSLDVTETNVIVNESNPRGLALNTVVSHKDFRLNIINYHGVSQPPDKQDTPDRLRQSRELVEYYKTLEGPVILGGDFNFSPDTKSYDKIRSTFAHEHIMDDNVPTTLNRLYWEAGPQRLTHSDYVFTSASISVTSIDVPVIEASDHLPLILELELQKHL